MFVQHLVRGQRPVVIDAHALHVQVGTWPDLNSNWLRMSKFTLSSHLEAADSHRSPPKTAPLFVGLHGRIEHAGNADIRTRLELGTHRVFT